MAGKGAGRLTMECAQLVGCEVPLPDVLHLNGFVSLLAGTADRANPDYRTWVRLAWDWANPGRRWEGDDERSGNYQGHQVELLLTNIDRATAAKWLKSLGESKDTLSEPVKHWLGDCLGRSGNPGPRREKRLALLRQVVDSLRVVDPDLDLQDMPGTREDLLEHCKWAHPGAFEMSVSTFKGYLSGICSFRANAGSTNYYRDIRPRLVVT
jgi:hypothetical protein